MHKTEIQHLTFHGDKSISHRLLLLSLLTDKKLIISNLPESKDVNTSLSIIKQLGVKIERNGNRISLSGGLTDRKFNEEIVLDCGNSGTTARLLCGILCNFKGKFKLIGDESLSKRPMDRVVKPLRDLAGIHIQSIDGHLPVFLESNGKTQPIDFFNETGSAQVKSAILFAGFKNNEKNKVIENIPSRDHTEILLDYLSEQKSDEVHFNIPGDISSAAYFAVLAAVMKQEIKIKKLLLNPTRTGFFRVLRRMGVEIEEKITDNLWESVGDVRIKGNNLTSTNINKEEIPSLIDELPILAIAMAFSKGTSKVSGAQELRVKESDRINGLISQLKKVGINCVEKNDGFEITGPNHIISAELDSFNDHRLAMSFAVLEYCSKAKFKIKGRNSVNISFPDFYEKLNIFTKSDCGSITGF